MRDKVRGVFLAVLIVALAGAAQAETIVPMVVGYSATYEVHWAGYPENPVPNNPYTASMEIISGPQDVNGMQWWTLQFTNWDGFGETSSVLIHATDQALYVTDPANPQYNPATPHFQIASVGTSWTDEGGRPVTITAIGDISTPAGSFSDVYTLSIDDYSGGSLYQTFTEYWKPGVGFLGEIVPISYGGSGNPRTTYLTGYATPVPPSLLLLGSGLVGLLALRRFRRG